MQDYSKHLEEVLNKPGIISDCYSVFHRYSVGNWFLAHGQLHDRGYKLSPIATFKKWKELGRKVKKGEKALTLALPVTIKEKDADGNETGKVFRIFKYVPRWFSLDQTEGEEYKPETTDIDWDKSKALKELGISQEKFAHADGNCQGYAYDATVAVNPLAKYKTKTLFHELAHVVLGHTKSGKFADNENTERNIKEVEAESVAYILCKILNLPGDAESRGYVQHWLSNDKIDNKSSQKIFGAVDKILRAGQ